MAHNIVQTIHTGCTTLCGYPKIALSIGTDAIDVVVGQTILGRDSFGKGNTAVGREETFEESTACCAYPDDGVVMTEQRKDLVMVEHFVCPIVTTEIALADGGSAAVSTTYTVVGGYP